MRRGPGPALARMVLGVLTPATLAALAAALLAAGCNSAPGHAGGASAQAAATVPTVETVRVAQRPVDFVVALPAELRPFEAVSVFSKVTGFVRSIRVDRGSRITGGELLAQLEAPEIVSQESEAVAKVASAENRRTEAQAKLAGDEDTYKRLVVASATPGVISENELEVAQKLAEADKARALGLDNAVAAAKAELRAAQVMKGYLRIEAPFTGIVTARNVHPGALVGPAGGGNAVPMLRIEQISVLRLVVAVPEAYVAGVVAGAQVSFSVPAFPGQTFSGTVARISSSLDARTRTMPVELDVQNRSGDLAPGMFPTVSWPVHRPHPSLLVPQSALVRTQQRTFVIRVRNGLTDWVDVKPGVTAGDDVEVFGDLSPRDEVVLQASEELPPNTRVRAHLGGAAS
ncbi:MAG: efflux RND transporter periplasmic adaptor subunit [Steroidobacteraceae bacterium]